MYAKPANLGCEPTQGLASALWLAQESRQGAERLW